MSAMLTPYDRSPPGFHIFSPLVDHRDPTLYCQCCDLRSLRNGDGSRHHHKGCVSVTLACGSKCRVEILRTLDVEKLKLDSEYFCNGVDRCYLLSVPFTG